MSGVEENRIKENGTGENGIKENGIEEGKIKGVNYFTAIGWVTVVYALIFGICLYHNVAGIMTIVMAVATVLYIRYCSVRLDGCSGAEGEKYGDAASNKKLYPYYAGVILLGISVFCTADPFVINVDYIGMFLLALCILIRIFCDNHTWRFGKNVSAMLEMIFSPLLYIDRSFRDYAAMRKTTERRKNSTIKYILIGIIIAIPAVVIVISLLASADVVFARIINDTFGDVHITADIFLFPLFVFCVFIYVYGLLVKMSTEGIDNKTKMRQEKEPVIGITFTGILTFIYLVFSVIQIMYLFAGNMMLPDGYSYSEYAREGFFQLLFVAFLNLLIVMFSVSVFRKHKVLDIILTVMSLCTYIMIASSAVRMLMYIREYDLTYLRILVLLALLMIAAVMTGTVISIYSSRFPLLRYTVFAVGIIWIAFSFCRPGYLIAKYNVNQMDAYIPRADIRYLTSLGDDAAPALCELAEKLDDDDKYILSEYFQDIMDDWKENDHIRGFNVAKYQAYVHARQYSQDMPGR